MATASVPVAQGNLPNHGGLNSCVVVRIEIGGFEGVESQMASDQLQAKEE
jgi:hypothetical protein